MMDRTPKQCESCVALRAEVLRLKEDDSAKDDKMLDMEGRYLKETTTLKSHLAAAVEVLRDILIGHPDDCKCAGCTMVFRQARMEVKP
jgi:hypothetical protein